MDSYDANQDKQINLEDVDQQDYQQDYQQDIVQDIENLQINTKSSTDNSIVSDQITEFDEIKWLTGC
jgi:hypothetical protein